jgi:hypothetical protein
MEPESTFFKTARRSSLSWARSIQSFPSYFFKFYCNIILPSPPWSSKWPLSFRFPHQKPVCFNQCSYGRLRLLRPQPMWRFFMKNPVKGNVYRENSHIRKEGMKKYSKRSILSLLKVSCSNSKVPPRLA